MTKQEIFDTVVAHLRTQNRKSVIDQPVMSSGEQLTAPICAYRSLDGLKCAVGCLIDDNDYNTSMEGRFFNLKFIDLFRDKQSISRLKNEAEFCQELQSIHDTVNLKDWEKYLTNIATKYNLTYSPLLKVQC